MPVPPLLYFNSVLLAESVPAGLVAVSAKFEALIPKFACINIWSITAEAAVTFNAVLPVAEFVPMSVNVPTSPFTIPTVPEITSL
jgi:hypothetical protein